MAPSPVLALLRREMDPLAEGGKGSKLITIPLVGMIISVILAMISLVIISIFLTQRFLAVKIWGRLPFVQWLVFAIYADSFLFVFATGILQFGLGVDTSMYALYEPYPLLVNERLWLTHIIRPTGKKPRMRSKLYLTNSFGMIGIYCGVVVRFKRVENGQCIIGMKKVAMIPLIAFDLLVNIYLTILFLIPLTSLYSFKNVQQTKASKRLKTIALRTFIGCICTLVSSVVNLSVLMALDGEPGWPAVLFSAIVIQWVTSRDSTSSHADSISVSQPHSYAGDELGHMRSQRSRQRTSRTGDPTLKSSILTSGNRGSVDSDCSPRMTPSTDAIVRDMGEIFIDEVGNQSPVSTSGPFAEDKRLVTSNSSSRALGTEDEKEKDMRLPRVPPPSRTGTGRYHVSSASEVMVHVDYGSSLSRETRGEAVRLGNSIVIGTGELGDGTGRGSPWGIAEAPL
ncbi:hypothetical protein OQA88_11415 [Cercophora sp. LCS_1]